MEYRLRRAIIILSAIGKKNPLTDDCLEHILKFCILYSIPEEFRKNPEGAMSLCDPRHYLRGGALSELIASIRSKFYLDEMTSGACMDQTRRLRDQWHRHPTIYYITYNDNQLIKTLQEQLTKNLEKELKEKLAALNNLLMVLPNHLSLLQEKLACLCKLIESDAASKNETFIENPLLPEAVCCLIAQYKTYQRTPISITYKFKDKHSLLETIQAFFASQYKDNADEFQRHFIPVFRKAGAIMSLIITKLVLYFSPNLQSANEYYDNEQAWSTFFTNLNNLPHSGEAHVSTAEDDPEQTLFHGNNSARFFSNPNNFRQSRLSTAPIPSFVRDGNNQQPEPIVTGSIARPYPIAASMWRSQSSPEITQHQDPHSANNKEKLLLDFSK